MKKSILVINFLMVVAGLSIVSCSNDDGITCPDPLVGEMSAEEAEFTGEWVVVAMEANEALDITDDEISNPSTDVFAQFSDCQRDLAYIFMEDRSYTQKQGYKAPLCKNQDSIAGTWGLTENNSYEDILTFVANCSTLNLKIEMNKWGDAFTYKSNVRFQDVNNEFKTVSVKFTYEKSRGEVSPQ